MSIDPITGISRSQFVQVEFTQIARRYELMNQIMTFGQVNNQRRIAIKALDIQPEMSILDLGAGGGQISSLIQKMYPGCKIFPSDFNADMIHADKNHTSLPFNQSDARSLPFPDNRFDRVICGFLLRNIRDYQVALGEILRVLKPGGKFVTLDTTPPAGSIFTPFIWLYMRLLIPVIGSVVTGRLRAYRYLIRSSEGFTPAEKLEKEFQGIGFRNTGFKRLMFGAFALHWGQKE
jgi:demethylmenaquinone methyltransferase/2-methoxy-6-polyprenyl-1,4-benzoquinol methylase